jgi:6-phosphogluconolactonase
MPVPVSRIRAATLVLAFMAGFLLLAANAMASHGALYTQTNDPSGNAVQRFDRARDGSLTPAGTFATGGAGLATLGGRQGAVELSGNGPQLRRRA